MKNKYDIAISEVSEKSEPIEYAIDVKCMETGVQKEFDWANLTVEGIWVNRGFMKDTDVRLTVLKGVEALGTKDPITAAEKVALLLIGEPYEY